MAVVLYIIGILGFVGAFFVFAKSPLLFAPALGMVISSIFIMAFARLLQLVDDINRNTLQAANYFRDLKNKEDEQAKQKLVAQTRQQKLINMMAPALEPAEPTAKKGLLSSLRKAFG